MTSGKKIIFACLVIFGLSLQNRDALAQSTGSAITLQPYRVEFTPVLGTLLPRDIWGTPGTLNTVGLRSSVVVSDPDGAIEVSGLYHYAGKKDPADHAVTFDVSWRQEFKNDLLNAYFNIGMHYSKWTLDLDYANDGSCFPENCQTDSGTHTGYRVGAGVIIPLGPNTPLKLAMDFYNGPQLLLLLEMGVGIRF